MLGRGGHLSVVAVAGRPLGGELRVQLAQIQGQHEERTIVVAEASANGYTTSAWLTVDDWNSIVDTVRRLLAHDREALR